jgi:aspartyl-tRNA(Asn)/glutamyl-tRNA(Gln) amidotransferase subunit B
MRWEPVIGLEVHLQLATRSKIFSGSPTAFGAEPNTQASAVDLAMPGMLPVLNEQAVCFAVKFGLGIGAQIGRRSVFDRKNYFYPDLPKGYQISQFEAPIVGRGGFEILLDDGSTRTIGITRAHLEEDAGKSLHEDFHGQTGIDLNRAGTPLLEIVSEPDIRSAAEAVAYLKALHSLVTYLGISDGNMAEGSMRCDVNISLRAVGAGSLGTRAEIKNVNSFRFVEKAIRYEIARQSDILDDGGKVQQETRLYDAERDETRPMRSKEVANDYRYFPEPDLLPVVIDEAYINAIRDTLPELPADKRRRFCDQYGLSQYDANVLSDSRALADYFEAVVSDCGDAKIAANWVQVELLGQLNRAEYAIEDCPVAAADLAALIRRILDDTISGKIAKQVFEAMWRGEGDADGIIEARGLRQVSDSGALERIVDDVIGTNAAQVLQYREADDAKRKKLLGFFVGQVMKSSKGQANPQMVNDLLAKKLV